MSEDVKKKIEQEAERFAKVLSGTPYRRAKRAIEFGYDLRDTEVSDNAVRVLRAAKSLLDSHDALNLRIKLGIPLSLTYAIEKLEEAVEESTKRD